jgi:hypothetical protein
MIKYTQIKCSKGHKQNKGQKSHDHLKRCRKSLDERCEGRGYKDVC